MLGRVHFTKVWKTEFVAFAFLLDCRYRLNFTKGSIMGTYFDDRLKLYGY